MLRDADTQVIGAGVFLFHSGHFPTQHQDRLRQLGDDQKFFSEFYRMVQLQAEVPGAQIVEHSAHTQTLIAGSRLHHDGGKRPSNIWGCGALGRRTTVWRDLGAQSWGNLS